MPKLLDNMIVFYLDIIYRRNKEFCININHKYWVRLEVIIIVHNYKV